MKIGMGPAAAIAALALVAALMLAFAVGRFPLAPGDVLALVWSELSGTPHGLPATAETVLWQIRMPRAAAAVMVGAALAAAGAAYQGLFRNPLVAPDILGVSAGAALGAALGIFLSFDLWSIQALSFGFGLAAVGAVALVGNAIRTHDPILVLILAGVAIGALLASILALLKYLADPYNQLPAITFWLLGSLAATNRDDVAATLAPVALGLIPLWLLRWRMNVMALGDEEARALGVNAGRVRIVVIAGATLMTAAVVSISGIIGWIGLLIPHFARLIVGPNFSRLLPAALLLGATFMLLVDTLARTLARIELPLGVLTAFVGTPFFVWLLATVRRGWQ